MPHRSADPILIVDDYTRMLRIIRGLLRQLGYEQVEEASDGASALARLRQKPFRLVISDWNMEPMSGLELLRAVRADPVLAGAAVHHGHGGDPCGQDCRGPGSGRQRLYREAVRRGGPEHQDRGPRGLLTRAQGKKVLRRERWPWTGPSRAGRRQPRGEGRRPVAMTGRCSPQARGVCGGQSAWRGRRAALPSPVHPVRSACGSSRR